MSVLINIKTPAEAVFLCRRTEKTNPPPDLRRRVGRYVIITNSVVLHAGSTSRCGKEHIETVAKRVDSSVHTTCYTEQQHAHGA